MSDRVPQHTEHLPPLKEPSPREVEIARLLVERFSDKEIAERLGIGTGTVHTHLDRMRAKSGLHDRRALGEWALAGQSRPGVYVIFTDTGAVDALADQAQRGGATR